MRINRAAKEFYALDIVTDPVVTGPWEASFDGGETWVTGDADGAGWQWLLAGPDADPTDATVIDHSVSPLVRHTSNPEVIVREDVPRVTLYP